MSETKTTRDHQQIKKWTEERGGVPAKIKNTGDDATDGILRIHFPDASDQDDKFEEIEWNDFFENFDESGLSFLYQEEKKDGEKSTFHKFVNAE